MYNSFRRFILIIFISWSCNKSNHFINTNQPQHINVKDYGAIGDGISDGLSNIGDSTRGLFDGAGGNLFDTNAFDALDTNLAPDIDFTNSTNFAELDLPEIEFDFGGNFFA